MLTLSPPSSTLVPFANSLGLNETPSNSASHPEVTRRLIQIQAV